MLLVAALRDCCQQSSAGQDLPLLMMDLSKKDRVEDAYKVKGILIKLSQ